MAPVFPPRLGLASVLLCLGCGSPFRMAPRATTPPPARRARAPSADAGPLQPGSNLAPAPAPASYRATVRVHSACSTNVRVFRGSTRGRYTAGGTYGWHSSNTITTYHLSGDDELCIVEDDRLVVSCVKPANGTQLQITESCTGFRRR